MSVAVSQDIDVSLVIEKIRSVLPKGAQAVPLHEPVFRGREWEYVKECLDTGWVSSTGKFVDQFERDLESFTGATSVVATVNGSCALYSALKLLGIEAGDEVIVPTLSFVAPANAVADCGATPFFVDCDSKSFGVDPEKLEAWLVGSTIKKKGRRVNKATNQPIKALILVHVFGHACDIERIVKTCKRFGLSLIEDAAEALGTRYKQKHVGTFGDIGILSFNGNKIVSTGGGGALLFNDSDRAKLARHLTTTAKKSHPWEYYHDHVGFNFRLPNINAALGCAQLECIDEFLDRKRNLAGRYEDAFRDVSGLKFITESGYSRSNYWLNTLLLDDNQRGMRNHILEQANAAGILARPAWTPIHKFPMYQKAPKMNLTNAESLAGRLINLPSSANL